jgi:hypothetical protein
MSEHKANTTKIRGKKERKQSCYHSDMYKKSQYRLHRLLHVLQKRQIICVVESSAAPASKCLFCYSEVFSSTLWWYMLLAARSMTRPYPKSQGLFFCFFGPLLRIKALDEYVYFVRLCACRACKQLSSYDACCSRRSRP